MEKYELWVINRLIKECNDLITEELEGIVRPLELRVPYATVGDELRKFYDEESKRQARFGKSIMNPPMILVNKIRHEFINYDDVRDDMTNAVRNRIIDRCKELEMRTFLVKRLDNIAQAVIKIIANKNDQFVFGSTSASRESLFRASKRYSEKELGDIMADIRSLNCPP
jgi:hypothetical protein